MIVKLKEEGGCNPCYNGDGVHLFFYYTKLTFGCNPCYNGDGVHSSSSVKIIFFKVVILVIMEMAYTKK